MKNLIEKIPQFLFFTGKGGVGKTSMSCAISLALAKEGKKVLLISTDPASNLDEVLETKLKSIPTKINGVENLEAMNINPVVAAHEYKEKMVAPFRGVLPQSAIEQMEEQLSGACTVEIAGFNEFSKYVGDIDISKNYEHIILDTAPLMLVTDTFLFADMADATIYVTRSGYTEKELIAFANKNIDQKKIKNVGFVLNDVAKDYFGYGNKYGYGYGAKEKGFFERLREKL